MIKDYRARLVFVLALVFGFLFAFLLPPFQGPDEEAHFFRIVTITEGNFFAEERAGVWGYELPASLLAYAESHRHMRGRMDEKYSYKQWYVDSHKQAPLEPRVFVGFSTQSTSPLMYLPQVVGILVGKIMHGISPLRVLDFNWSVALYFGRLGNVIAFAVGMALAIRIAPRFAGILSFVALMPMTLHLAGSVSYDPPTILAAVGFFALIVSIAEEKRGPSLREQVALGTLGFFLSHAKVVYAPLLLTVYLLSPWMSREAFLKLCGVLGVISVMGIVLGGVIFGVSKDASVAAASSQQLEFLTSNIGYIPELIYNSLVHNLGFYGISILGNLGALDTNFTLGALVALWGVLLCALVGDAIEGSSSPWGRGTLVILVGCLLSLIAIMLATYVIWTSILASGGIGAAVIDGVQGRHLIPIVPYALGSLAVMPAATRNHLRGARADILSFQYICSAAILCLTVFVLVFRYWVS